MKECEQCHKKLSTENMFGIVIRNGKFITTCEGCFKVIHASEVKQMNINKQQLAMSGYLELGFKESDIKEAIRLWGKKQVSTL
jgi:hypothetical protein